MKRRLFNVLAGISLVLCVATAMLWMRSFTDRDFFMFQLNRSHCNSEGREIWHSRRNFSFEIMRGGSLFSVDTLQLSVNPMQAENLARQHIPFFEWLGYHADEPYCTDYPTQHFSYHSMILVHADFLHDGQYIDERRHDIHVPLWFVAIVFGIAPIIHLGKRYLPSRPKIHSLWPTCGYDLRATPDRCPECGTTTLKAI
jgi:hypothetical protein